MIQSTTIPHIIVDTREKLPLDTIRNFHLKLEFKQLEVGDYACSEGCCAWERKEGDVTNFAKVIQQAEELKAAYKNAFLVFNLNGSDFLRENHSRYGTRIAFVASLIARGVPPLFIKEHHDMLEIIAHAIKKLHDGKRRGLHEFNPVRHVTKKDLQLNLLTALPGISSGRAQTLIHSGHSIRDILNMTEKQLCEFDGIGPKTAKKIREVLG